MAKDPYKQNLLDEEAFELVTSPDELKAVAKHLGLEAMAAHEDWSGVLVGRDLVFVSNSGSPELRDWSRFECVFNDGKVVSHLKEEETHLREQAASALKPIHGYYVNLDERGSFFADVRNADGRSVFQVYGGNELPEDDSSLVDDGFMRHFRDIDGLRDYLLALSVLPAGSTIYESAEFERILAQQQEAWASQPEMGPPAAAKTPPDLEEIRSGLLSQSVEASAQRPRQRA